jgi:hypothetical protein
MLTVSSCSCSALGDASLASGNASTASSDVVMLLVDVSTASADAFMLSGRIVIFKVVCDIPTHTFVCLR